MKLEYKLEYKPGKLDYKLEAAVSVLRWCLY